MGERHRVVARADVGAAEHGLVVGHSHVGGCLLGQRSQLRKGQINKLFVGRGAASEAPCVRNAGR